MYLRISLDDDTQDVSNSVVNQQDLLSAYVAADPVLSAGEVLVFADDGWSGTNFERPQVKALLDLVRRGGVQNIVVKDLSRWGRNYPEVSEYLDQIFPFLGVRFISVNDQYDSNDHKGQTAPMGVAFSSIVHDIYSKELSVKVKQAHVSKAKKGEYVVGTVPYGFIRPKEKDNRLIIDEAAAIVIRRIFDMASEGMQNTKIVATLNAEGIDSPLEHRRRNGRSTLALRPKAGRSFWDAHMLYRILGDERYTGTLVYAKTKKVSRNATGGKKREIKLPEAEWIRVPDALPAIISAELFEKVNERRRKNKRGSQSGERNTQPRSPFVGKIICGHCGQKLSLSQTRNPFFRCLSVKRNTGLGCYGGMVRVNDLNEVLLATVKLEAQKALDLIEQRQSQKQAHSPVSAEKDSVSSEIKRLTANIALLEQRGMALYEAFAEGTVDRESYVTAKVTNGADLEATQNRIAELNQRLATIEMTDASQPSVVNETALHRILTATEATGKVMSLLDRMIIYDGGRIEVRFVFSNPLTTNEKMEGDLDGKQE